MKTTTTILLALLSLGLVYAFTSNASEKTPAEESDHVILSYTINDMDYRVFYGGTRTESLKAEKGVGIQNAVVNYSNKLSAEGYSLVSTTTVGIPGKMSPDILLFFERRK